MGSILSINFRLQLLLEGKKEEILSNLKVSRAYIYNFPLNKSHSQRPSESLD